RRHPPRRRAGDMCPPAPDGLARRVQRGSLGAYRPSGGAPARAVSSARSVTDSGTPASRIGRAAAPFDDTHSPPRRVRGWATALPGRLLLPVPATLPRWPAPAELGTMAVALGDPLLTTWILAWDAHAPQTAPLRFFDANMFHPRRGTLA